MKEQFLRSAMLIGCSGVETLSKSKVIVFGVGGVGSFAVEALARCGLSKLDIVDSDIVSASNINRQLIALNSTVGLKKVDVAKKRILDISPNTEVTAFDMFYDSENFDNIDLSQYNYVVDAIDSMESKVLLIKNANKYKVPIISVLSTGNKMDPGRFKICDIYDTSVCPIAKILRKRLRQENIESLKVVYSTEEPIMVKEIDYTGGKRNVGSISFVPSVAGLLTAGEVVRDLINYSEIK